MNLKGNKSIFEIDILGKSNPNSTDESDKRWLKVNLKIELDGFNTHQHIELYDDDFIRFYNSIKIGLNNFSMPIEFNTVEESIYLKGIVETNGRIYWDGFTIYPIGDGNKLIFKFETELIQIDNLLAELEYELKDLGIL